MHAFAKKLFSHPVMIPLKESYLVFQVQDKIMHSAIWSSMLSIKLGEYNLKTVAEDMLECKGQTHFGYAVRTHYTYRLSCLEIHRAISLL